MFQPKIYLCIIRLFFCELKIKIEIEIIEIYLINSK